MKNLIFSLILVGSVFVPSVTLGQENNTYYDINLLNPGTTNSTLSDDELFLQRLPDETASQYIQRIDTENQRRRAAGETLLPDPRISTNPRPTGDNPVPLVGARPPANQPSSNQPTQESNFTIFDQIVPKNLFNGSSPLNVLLNQLFYVGLAVAVILAIVMIVRGGIEYMTVDSMYSKDSGKKRVQAALGGLLLAFSAILILNTINPNITKLNLGFDRLKAISSIKVDGALQSGTRPGIASGSYGSWNEATAESWVNGLQPGVRSIDGRLVVSVYSATGDSVTDSNTAALRGNSNNLLREGSVALSPDLIRRYRPTVGQEIFINGTSVGFYEDTTAESYNGVQFRNTIDIFDENNSLGTRNILNNIPAGDWNITFGNARPQISNP